MPEATPPPLPNTELVTPSYRWGRAGLVLAVIAILTCAVWVVRHNDEERLDETQHVSPNRILEMGARYAVGVKGLMQMTGQWNSAVTDTMVADLSNISQTDEDTLRIEILKGWMADAGPSSSVLADLATKNADLKTDIATLNDFKTAGGQGADDSWKKLHQRHGWMAELARAQSYPEKSPERQAIVEQSISTAMVLLFGSAIGLMAAAAGLVMMILAILRFREGRLRLTLKPVSRADGGILIEGFALYLALFLVLPGLLTFLPFKLPRWIAYFMAFSALGFGLLWPLWRGMKKASWREALGLHRGQGLWREMGAGVLGWMAVLPLLILGMVAASWITKFTGVPPTHPIMEEFSGNGWIKIGVVMLAVIWAPVSEELMFRGLLFPGLSAWLRWVIGILTSAFIFAVIHPQGWAGVPAIMALAAGFSLLRMWRQSLIAPMTAHALNNGLVCVMMLLL
jgi:membrane protease YdiL (CAAX protease family)